MQLYGKPPLRYSDQIALLRSRDLVIPDVQVAEEWLRRVGYYRLSAYFIPFKIAESDAFKPETTFEQIVGLYLFDAQLRKLFMTALDAIEVAVRAALTYHLAHACGPFGHANPQNFIRNFDHRSFMMGIDREERRSKELFLSHFREVYSDYELPIWMATELLSFGAISLLYKHIPPKNRKPIAHVFHVPEAVLESWLHALTNIRNICAHHNRLWNRELPVPPHYWIDGEERGFPTSVFTA
jgi:abortive infection bacteriophage resistance protein